MLYWIKKSHLTIIKPLLGKHQNNVTKYVVLLCLVIYTSLSLAQSTVGKLYENQQSGDATYFVESDAGNCQVSPTLPAWGQNLDFQVALNNQQYMANDKSAGCGICVQAQYTGSGSGATPPPKNFTALVVDRCPECLAGDLDLARNGGDGRWDITWQAINCPVGEAKLAYLFEGSNSFFIKIGVRNHRIAVTSLQIRTQKNEPYVTATRQSDNFFTCPECKYPMKFPIALKITGVNQQTLRDQVPELINGQLINGLDAVQFNSINDIIFTNDFEVK